jgi:hypothetical protein
MLNSESFRDSDKLLWTALGRSLIPLVLDPKNGLIKEYANFLAHIAAHLNGLVRPAGMVLRIEAFIQALLKSSAKHKVDMLCEVFETLTIARRRLFDDFEDLVVRSLLVFDTREMVKLRSNACSGDAPAQLAEAIGMLVLTVPEGAELTPITLSEFIEFLDIGERKENLPSALINSFKVEFALQRGMSLEGMKAQESLLEDIFISARLDLSAFLLPLQDNSVVPRLPSIAFRICAHAVREQLRNAQSWAKDLNSIIGVDRPNLRRRVLSALLSNEELESLAFVMSVDRDDLRAIVLKPTQGYDGPLEMDIDVDPMKGISIQQTVKYILDTPTLFAHERARVESRGIVDTGGLTRGLLDSMMKHVLDNLTAPFSEENAAELKFVWGISKEVGKVVGMLCGKLIQKDLRLPFTFHEEIFKVIADPTVSNVQNYYRRTYQSDIDDFKQRFLMQKNTEMSHSDFLECLTVTPLDKLELATLERKANVTPRHDQTEFVTDLDGWTRENVVEKYFEGLEKRVFDEFVGFFNGFHEGFSTFARVHQLRHLPRLAPLMIDLLCAQPLTLKIFWKAVSLSRQSSAHEEPMDALIKGYKLPALKVFKSIVYALTAKQLSKLNAVWTGSSTTTLKPGTLWAEISKPSVGQKTLKWYLWMTPEQQIAHCSGQEIPLMSEASPASIGNEKVKEEVKEEKEREKGRFDEKEKSVNMTEKSFKSDTDVMGDEIMEYYVVNPGAEYMELVRRVAAIQHDMLLLTGKPADPFENVKIHDGVTMVPLVNTCPQYMVLPWQESSSGMLHGIVIHLNSPTYNFQDYNVVTPSAEGAEADSDGSSEADDAGITSSSSSEEF